MKRLLFVLFVVLMALASSAFAGGIDIVCTSFPCYDAARTVAGDAAQIKMLLKPASEVHTYDPPPADILVVASCDLFIYVGGESDAWVEDILASFGDEGPRALRLFDSVEARREEIVEGMTASEEEDGEYDEHIWTAPENEMKIIRAVAEALSAADPDNADRYTANADTALQALEELDGEFRRLIDGAKRRELVFADRFPILYFVRAYGLDYTAAFPSCAAESEPSAKTLMYLIDRVRSHDIPVIYKLELSSGRTAETIAAETGAEIETFYSMQTVSLSDFEAEENYLSLMRRNLEALKRGLN